jgi:hypothetical protein
MKKFPKPFDLVQSIYHPDSNPNYVIAIRAVEDYFSIFALGNDGQTRIFHDYELEGWAE